MMTSIQVKIIEPFKRIFEDLKESLPTVIGMISFIIVSWLVIKIVLFVVKKGLAKTKVDEWSKKLSNIEIFGNKTVKIVLTTVILTVIKWFLIFLFVMVGAEIFGLHGLSEAIRSFFAYLPNLLTALAIFIGGVYLGTLLRKTVQSMFKSLELSGGNLIGNLVFYIIAIFLTITALDQAGVDTSVIKNNLTLLIGSILLAFTIAFGLGAKDAITRLLFGYYSRKNIGIGQRIKIGDVEGVVEAIDNICLTIKTVDGKVILPIRDVVDHKVILK